MICLECFKLQKQKITIIGILLKFNSRINDICYLYLSMHITYLGVYPYKCRSINCKKNRKPIVHRQIKFHYAHFPSNIDFFLFPVLNNRIILYG